MHRVASPLFLPFVYDKVAQIIEDLMSCVNGSKHFVILKVLDSTNYHQNDKWLFL